MYKNCLLRGLFNRRVLAECAACASTGLGALERAPPTPQPREALPAARLLWGKHVNERHAQPQACVCSEPAKVQVKLTSDMKSKHLETFCLANLEE